MYKYTNDDIPQCLKCKSGKLTRSYWLNSFLKFAKHKEYDYGVVQCDCCGTTYWIVTRKDNNEIRLLQKVETFEGES